MSEYWEYVSTQLLPTVTVPSSLGLASLDSVVSSDQLASLTGGLIVDSIDLLYLLLGLLTTILALYFLLPPTIRLVKMINLPFSLPSCSGCATIRTAFCRLGKLLACCGSGSGSADSAAAASVPKPPKLVRLSTTYTISNFLAADLLLEKESYLESAVFSASGHPKERFQLRVHPRAGKNGDEVSLFLRYVPVVETVAPPKTGVVAAAVESLENSAAADTSSSSIAAATPAAAAAVPVTKVATVHFVCRIGTPKELKAQIKAGEGAGWVNFISREELLRVLDAKKSTNLTIQLQGHLVV